MYTKKRHNNPCDVFDDYIITHSFSEELIDELLYSDSILIGSGPIE